MKRTWVIVAVAVVVLAAGYWWWQQQAGDDDAVAMDLVEAFRAAEKRTALDPAAAFSIEPQTIAGQTKPAIYAHPPSRIIYHDVTVPERGRIELFLAVKEEAWDKGTDGVYFRVGVSHGETYKDLVARTVDPYRNPGDRGWIPVSLDLSQFAGEKVNVVFNTQHSAPGGENTGMYDFAVFGAPRIVSAPAP